MKSTIESTMWPTRKVKRLILTRATSGSRNIEWDWKNPKIPAMRHQCFLKCCQLELVKEFLIVLIGAHIVAQLKIKVNFFICSYYFWGFTKIFCRWLRVKKITIFLMKHFIIFFPNSRLHRACWAFAVE